MMRRWVEEKFTQSVTYLAARNGIIVAHRAAGVHSPDENSPPLKKDAIFPLASITKLFTALAIMILYRRRPIKPGYASLRNYSRIPR